METVTISITGMACGGCSSAVQQALLALDGVTSAEVSHIDARAGVTFDPARITRSQIVSAVQAAGYQVV